MNLMPTPLLAIEGDIVGIIILVLTVLGYFVRAIKGNGDAPAVPPIRKNRPELKTEIEEFLEEISGKAARPEPPRPAPVQRQPEQRPPPRNRPPVKQTIKKGTNKPPLAKKSLGAGKPTKSLADQHLPQSNLGGGLRTHLATYMHADRVGQEAQRDVQSQIPAQIKSDLGYSGAAAATAVPKTVHPLVKLLRDPQGARTAIALQEILQRPKWLK